MSESNNENIIKLKSLRQIQINQTSEYEILGQQDHDQDTSIQVEKLQAAARLNQTTTDINEKLLRKASEGLESTEDAFRYMERGYQAEEDGRYREAVQNYINASERLVAAADTEIEERINRLLVRKATEVLSWAENLAKWIESDKKGAIPKRKSHGVSVRITNRKRSSNATNLVEFQKYDRDAAEFSNMHYTPICTKDPSQFTNDGHLLQCVKNGRYPRMMIVITMYNEEPEELRSTLQKCCNNIAYLQKNRLPGYEGEDAWKNILICIVSDGRTKAHPDTLRFLSELGLYDEDAMTIFSTGLDTQMHLFERSVIMNRVKNKSLRSYFSGYNNDQSPPLQLMFALKEHNAGKLHSHLWFYHAFCAQISPEYTVLVDVGTKPTKSSFYKLIAAMEVDRQVGGVCGEIAVDEPVKNLCNFVVAAQHYEYKISNILDKSTESLFGYISVLPGAFSAYRYEAIRGAPLDAYFKSLTTGMGDLGPFYGNMYLAEDRILCFELLARENCSWTMLYVKDAIARTDVPTTLVDLINQRRRWLNGSFFAMIYTLTNWGKVYTCTNHSLIRKLFLCIQYFVMVIQTVFNWFLVANFYLTCYFVIFYCLEHNMLGVFDVKEFYLIYGEYMRDCFNISYGLMLGLQLIIGLGNKPKHIGFMYSIAAFYYLCIVLLTSSISIMSLLFGRELTLEVGILAASSVGIYFLAAIIHLEIHHILATFLQYACLLPTTINVLTIYSFCNLQDLSWGTKGLDQNSSSHDPSKNKDEKGKYKDILVKRKYIEAQNRAKAKANDEVKRRFESFRSNLLICWLLSNGLLVAFCLYYIKPDKYLPTIFMVIGLINIYRFTGSTLFVLYTLRQRLLLQCCLFCGILDKRYKRKRESDKRSQAFGFVPANFDGSTMTPKGPYVAL